MTQSLRKGIEEESFTGTRSGQTRGLANQIAGGLPGFSTEPDARVIEFATAPHDCVSALIDEVLSQRRMLSRKLLEIGNYVVVPGASIPLSGEDAFCITDEENPYYRFIRQHYGGRVVTSSTHVSIGIEDPEQIMRVCRVLRCEAALFLALTAASPFYRGELTGYHSTRWHLFPQVPEKVPLFPDHASFMGWVQQQLGSGAMFNTRHLWLSVRPNGPRTPHQLSRVELRICDRVEDHSFLRALVEFLEWRVLQILGDPHLDPLLEAGLDPGHLTEVIRTNEAAAARDSLDARILEWRSGRKLPVREWIEGFLVACPATLLLAPLRRRLQEGSPAQRWLRRYRSGESIEEIVADTIEQDTEGNDS